MTAASPGARRLRWRPAGRSAAVLAGLLVLAAAAGAEQRTLQQAVYDYAVAGYCGLITPAVEAGFKQEVESLTEDGGFSPEEARAERIAGWVKADEEWSNRGLGGFRAWCEGEGEAAAEHFLRIVRDQ